MHNAIRLMALTFVVGLANAAPAQAQPIGIAAQLFTVTDIGPNVYPVAINALGQVAANGSCPTCGPNQQALLWSASTGLIDLGGSANDFIGGSAASGLNDLGEVAGISNSPFAPIPCCDAFIWSPTGEIQDLGSLPPSVGCSPERVVINDREEVIGSSGPNTFPSNVTCPDFLWESKIGMQQIGLPSGALTAGVSGINNAGVVVGSYQASDFSGRSYVWTSQGGFRDLGIPQSLALGISNNGHVVGQLYSCPSCSPSTNGHAFLWDRQHGARDLGTLPGHTNSSAQALNVRDQVVGYSALFFTGPYPFLWTKATGMLNLNLLIDTASGWQLIDATGINASGQITGWGIFKGENHGFVLTPKDTV
jgi:uncharacterized membrane protein